MSDLGNKHWLAVGLFAATATMILIACSPEPYGSLPDRIDENPLPPTPILIRESKLDLTPIPTRAPASASRSGTPTEDLEDLGLIDRGLRNDEVSLAETSTTSTSSSSKITSTESKPGR